MAPITLAGGVTIGLVWLGLVGNAALFAATVALLIVAGRRPRTRPRPARRSFPAGGTRRDEGGTGDTGARGGS